MNRMQGKTVLITGAGAGIGEATCHRLSSEGAVIVAMDLNPDAAERVAKAIESKGGKAHALSGDISNHADCESAVNWVKEHLGAIHVLCNIAGIVDGGTLVEASEESWQRSMDINAKGAHYMCQMVVPLMVEQGGGSVVNMASVAGPFAVPGRGVYSVSKAAVIGLTKSLAIDFIGQGIRVNAICPGTVESPSWHDRIKQSPDPEQALKDFIARQPMGRVGQPEEIAALVAYLAADESAYMTGQTLYIDGGMTI